MLGGTYAATQPLGLKKLVMSSAPASMKPFIEGTKARRHEGTKALLKETL
jgi:hypothetical protein